MRYTPVYLLGLAMLGLSLQPCSPQNAPQGGGPAVAASSTADPPRKDNPAEVAAYIARARAKIQQGDIAAARRLLERASESDPGEAWFALAETYDPQMLAQWGVLGVKPDLEKARTLYQKAETRGVQGARERLLAIRR
jgi:TPR repeat protein